MLVFDWQSAMRVYFKGAKEEPAIGRSVYGVWCVHAAAGAHFVFTYVRKSRPGGDFRVTAIILSSVQPMLLVCNVYLTPQVTTACT